MTQPDKIYARAIMYSYPMTLNRECSGFPLHTCML